jgi:nitrogenase molybdenum-iron protein beta chain
MIKGLVFIGVSKFLMNDYQLSVSFPAADRFILNSIYIDYDGALHLAEDIFSKLVSSNY